MSLFSRLDRVRDKAKIEAEAEEGMFAAAELGPRDSQGLANTHGVTNSAPPQESSAATQSDMPHDVPRQDFASQEFEPTQSTPDHLSASDETTFGSVHLPPAESPSDEVPPAQPTMARNPFDRLMAGRDAELAGEEEMLDKVSMDAMPTDDLPLGEALTDEVSSGEVPSSHFSAPIAAAVETPIMEDVSLNSDPKPDNAEELPDFLRNDSTPPAADSVTSIGGRSPSDGIGVGSGSSSALERLRAAAAPAPVAAPIVTPVVSPGASMERMTPETLSERPFSDRFAGRAALDRDVQKNDPLSRAGEVAAAPTEASRAPLVRIENEAAQSEREGKNRAFYRRKHLMFDSVLGSIDQRLLQSPTRDSVRPSVEKGVDGALREFNLTVDAAERNWLIEEFLRETTDFGPLVSLLDDPGVNKILVSGSTDVAIEKLGRMERTGISFRDDDHLLSIIRRLAETVGGRIDAKVPLLDRPLPDGARVRAKIPPMAPQPTLNIEKSTGNPFIVLRRQQMERGRGDNLPYAQLRERIQQRLVREFEGDSLGTGNQEKLRGQVEEMINAVILEERVMVTRAERAALVMDLLNEIVGLGPIEPLLNDPDVDEVMVNGPYQIYVERKGKLELSSQRFRDNAHVMQVIERIVAPLGRRVDEKSPMVDGRLRDGSRFNAVIPPLALSGPTMTIRKFARDPFTMTDLINFGSLSREAAQFLQAAVEGRLNIVVSGGTGSGKTTTLNVLSSFIPTTERIITIEDAAELQLRQEHVIRLETRPPNIEGIGEVGVRELVRNALRMRPDRIVIGECRGGEALDMLQAMNTGHDGSLTTGHSNGPRDMLKRLETMVMMAGFDLPIKAIREQISMAVHLIVHQERMRDGKRRVTAVSELVGMEGDVITMQDIFRFEQERVDDEGRIIGSLVTTGLRPKHFDTIVDNGVEISMELFQPRVADSSRSRLEGRKHGR